MSERFKVMDNVKWQGKGKSCSFIDNWTNKVYFAENKTECERIVVLLNSLSGENEQLRKKYDNLYSAIEKTARDMAEKRIYEMEDFDVFQRITDYVEELDE